MKLALDQLKVLPEHIIVDGTMFSRYGEIKYTTIIKGDTKFQSIAAASILAKTYRDELMEDLHGSHPNYSWNKNKGYPTLAHRKAIREFGPTTHHRTSFRLFSE
jgi:ribonuclease HII